MRINTSIQYLKKMDGWRAEDKWGEVESAVNLAANSQRGTAPFASQPIGRIHVSRILQKDRKVVTTTTTLHTTTCLQLVNH